MHCCLASSSTDSSSGRLSLMNCRTPLTEIVDCALVNMRRSSVPTVRAASFLLDRVSSMVVDDDVLE